MTIHYKDDRDPFTVPYSEASLFRYQKILGDQIKDIEFNGMEAPIGMVKFSKDPIPKTPQNVFEKLLEIEKQNIEILSDLKKLNENLLTKT